MQRLLKNAVLSIQIAAEDYEVGTEGRNISCVRNIYAGLLLLYKYKLCTLAPNSDPELLIRKKFVASIGIDGKAIIKSSGDNTLDCDELRRRLLEVNIKVEKNRLETIRKLRNDFEHYYSNHPQQLVQEIISSAFVLIGDFITKHINNTTPSQLLGLTCWEALLKANELHEGLLQLCRGSIRQIDWPRGTETIFTYFRCSQCNSELVRTNATTYSQDLILECMACGREDEYSNVVEAYAEEAYWSYNYVAAKDGADSETVECPECGLETFIRHLRACIYCEYEPTYRECAVCGQFLSVEEQGFDGLCSYHANIADKERDK